LISRFTAFHKSAALFTVSLRCVPKAALNFEKPKLAFHVARIVAWQTIAVYTAQKNAPPAAWGSRQTSPCPTDGSYVADDVLFTGGRLPGQEEQQYPVYVHMSFASDGGFLFSRGE
jgi:hypothetical protein